MNSDASYSFRDREAEDCLGMFIVPTSLNKVGNLMFDC